MTLLINILLGFYVFVAVLMILVILMQRPKSEGLGAAFGGGVTENIFGAQTTNVLTKITGWLAAIFFLLTFALSILYAHKGNTQSELSRELMKDLPPAVATGLAHTQRQVPAATPGASPTPSATPGRIAAVGTIRRPATSPAPSRARSVRQVRPARRSPAPRHPSPRSDGPGDSFGGSR